MIAKEPSLCNQKRTVSLQLWIVAIAPIDSTWWIDEGFGGDCHDRPRLTAPAAAFSKLRFGFAFACMQVVHNMPSPMAGLRSALSLPMDSCHDRPSPRLNPLTLAGSKLRFGCGFACMELSTICHLRWRVWAAWGARRYGGKLLHPCGESAIFRVLVGSHPLHAKACTYLWAAFVWGGVK